MSIAIRAKTSELCHYAHDAAQKGATCRRLSRNPTSLRTTARSGFLTRLRPIKAAGDTRPGRSHAISSDGTDPAMAATSSSILSPHPSGDTDNNVMGRWCHRAGPSMLSRVGGEQLWLVHPVGRRSIYQWSFPFTTNRTTWNLWRVNWRRIWTRLPARAAGSLFWWITAVLTLLPPSARKLWLIFRDRASCSWNTQTMARRYFKAS